MKRNGLIFIAATFVAAILTLQPAFIYTNITTPPAGHTGAPGEQTCAVSGCHTGSSENLDPTKLSLASVATPSIASGYTPGSIYNMTVNMGTVQQPVKGFQVTALDQNNNGAGTFTLTNPNSTSLSSIGNRQYVGHNNANTTAAWTFRWQAPATNIGPVTFYLVGNGANGNASVAGDIIYRARYSATTSSFNQIILTGIQPVNADEVKTMSIYPNPFRERLNVQYYVHDESQIKFELFDIAGSSVAVLAEKTDLPGYHQLSFDLNEKIKTGVYILRINEGEKVYFKKLLAE